MPKPALEAYLSAYADHPHAPGSWRLADEASIPLIGFSALALLSWISLGAPFGYALHMGHVAWLAATLFYLSLEPRLGALVGLVLAMCFPIAAVTPKLVVVLLALVGWGAHLAVRVVHEKRRPTFVASMLSALIGPLFFVAKLIGLWPARLTTVTSH